MRALRRAQLVAVVVAVACHMEYIDGGSGKDGGGTSGRDDAGDAGMPGPLPVDSCKGGRGSIDAAGPPVALQACTDSSDCEAPEVCIFLPGALVLDGGTWQPQSYCGAPCASDCDCPQWLTCHGGFCDQCNSDASACPVGQQCGDLGGGPGVCTSNTGCDFGNYCDGGVCQGYQVCSQCFGDCPNCNTNAQCAVGEVCVGGRCTVCSSDEQCGPRAKCAATHSGLQCTCASSTDCASGESCSGSLCAPGPRGCESCVGGAVCQEDGSCGPCATTAQCSGPDSFSGTGFACVGGLCTNCTANSQCGGGEACVDGTCGTCSTSVQCGTSGVCLFGFCVCVRDSQCAPGQRCGAGVCVEE
jgi:hypothetical protein